MDKPVLTAKETSEITGLSLNTVYKAIAEGQIRHVRMGRKILVLRKPLEEMLSGNEAAS